MTAIDPEQHPSLGNGYAYSHDFRLFSRYMRELENNGFNSGITQAQCLHLFLLEQVLDCHENRRLQLGQHRRYKK